MRLISSLTAAALIALPSIALAQASGADQPGAASTAPPSTSSESPGAATSTGAAAVTAGLPVKDKTGATIGSVVDVKQDASGKQVATIAMGADKFAVDTSALAVENGSAVINATQAEIKSMLPKGKAASRP